ncbi:DUF3329 domain-containing protein [Butyrivibrio sp. FCS014]|uniref:DUF3329 domain-containing protein n=1 Tax=Butyrivibrio sp. FCS014 TaxID=1408304 RepID=UPI0004631154|nr:DUF6056 family protein [Butyrivibrio sp. FCS014]
MPEKLRKKLFYIAVAVNFIMTAIYEFLTPNMSDDIIYGDAVAKANSFFDLFVQEYEHYMTHIGRNIAHIILRIFMYTGTKAVFNIAAAAAFTALGILIYRNIDNRKPYDLRVYLAITLLLWLFDPTISNSVFWETGACNYLFTALIMVGYITLFRKSIWEKKEGSILFAVGMFFFGVAAGWCNENTSGGVILFVLLMFVWKWIETKNFSGIRLWMITGLIGNIIGFVIMLLSPGNASRAEGAEEAHTGLLAMVARFLKITLNIKDYYLVLILTFTVMVIAIAYKTGSFKKFKEAAAGMLMFAFLFLATAYALIMVPESQLRTYYGASLFLMTAIVQGFAWIVNKGFDADLVQILATSLVTVLSIILIFTYIEDGANLARIKREFDERDAYLTMMTTTTDEKWLEAPMLRPGWENRFSMAYESDICEDHWNWLNLSYAQHYGIDFIKGVDRETWTKY